MKNKFNISLLAACIFCAAASIFTINATAVDPNDCNLCDGLERCIVSGPGQVGKTDCSVSGGDCELSGYSCWEDPNPGEG